MASVSDLNDDQDGVEAAAAFAVIAEPDSDDDQSEADAEAGAGGEAMSDADEPMPPYEAAAALVGRRIEVHWPLDEEWYVAKVTGYSHATGQPEVHYWDDDVVERLDLAKEEWRLDMGLGRAAAPAPQDSTAAEEEEEELDPEAQAAAAASAAAKHAAREAAADAAEAAGGRKSRRQTAGTGPTRFIESTFPQSYQPKKLNRARETQSEQPKECAQTTIESEWVQCAECDKWRIVKRSDIDKLPDDVAFTCSMNPDCRHNRCAAPQHLWMMSAPENGERIEPRGYTARATLESHRRKISDAEAEELQRRLPLSMKQAGWILMPSGGTKASHRLDYAYIGGEADVAASVTHFARVYLAADPVVAARAVTSSFVAGPPPTVSSIDGAEDGDAVVGTKRAAAAAAGSGSKKTTEERALEVAEQVDVPYFWDRETAIAFWEQLVHDALAKARAAERAAAAVVAPAAADDDDDDDAPAVVNLNPQGASAGAHDDAEEDEEEVVEVARTWEGMRLWLQPGTKLHRQWKAHHRQWSAHQNPTLSGTEVVGRRIEVLWPLDEEWYVAMVTGYSHATGQHEVHYLDDDVVEQLDLAKEEWRLESGVSTQSDISMRFERAAAAVQGAGRARSADTAPAAAPAVATARGADEAGGSEAGGGVVDDGAGGGSALTPEERERRLALFQALEAAVRRTKQLEWAGDAPVPGAEGWLVRWKPRARKSAGGVSGDAYMISPTGVSLDSFRKAEAFLGLSEAGRGGPAAAASEAGRGGPAAAAPPAEANIRRSARADARQQKERECVKKLLLTIISQPIPGLADPTGAASSAKASAVDGTEGSGRPLVGAVLGATVLPVSTRHKVKVEDDLFIPGDVLGASSVTGLAAASPTSIEVMDDPFFIPGNFASPPKLSDAELRAEAKLEAEREAKRQAQLAAQAVEEMRDRAEELLELIARAERLGVDSSVLSQVREYMAPRGAWPAACKCSLRRPLLPTQVREYMAKLGNAQKAHKSITTAERPVAPLRGPYCQTTYRGVFRKMLTFGGVRLRLYEAFHNATYLGVFGRKEEAAVAYAIHWHATKGLEAPEDDPFASPGAALQPDGDGGAGESANVPSLALKALSSLSAPIFKRSSGFRIGVDLVLPSNRRSLKGPDKGPHKGPDKGPDKGPADKGPDKRPVGSVTAGREEEAGVQRASLSACEIDARLWVGASAAGWTVYRRSGDGHYRYVSPDGAVYTQRPEEPTLSSRASPSKRQKEEPTLSSRPSPSKRQKEEPTLSSRASPSKRQKMAATSPAAVVSIPTPPRPLVAPTTAGPPFAAALPPPPQAGRAAAAPPPAPRPPAASAPPPASTAVLPSRSPSGPSSSPRSPAVAAAALSAAASPRPQPQPPRPQPQSAAALPRPQPQPPRPQPQVAGAATNEAPRGGTTAPSAPPLCERHPTIPGKLRVASSLMAGVSGGEKVAVRLPGCEHVVRITWPSEVKQYLTFTLGACPQCPR